MSVLFKFFIKALYVFTLHILVISSVRKGMCVCVRVRASVRASARARARVCVCVCLYAMISKS